MSAFPGGVPVFLPDLQSLAWADGAVLFGIANLNRIETGDFLLEPDTLRRHTRAISIAVPVSRTVLATIADHPNQLYFHHYRQLNSQLDRIALRLTQRIESEGSQALAIPASQIADWQNQRAHVSHKRVAVAAGLGWIGRSNLLVTPEYGSAIRLVTVLTDVPLDPTVENRDATVFAAKTGGVPVFASVQASGPGGACGECRACMSVCPARAIKESAEAFDHQACFAQLKEFQKQGHAGQYICGICVKACRPGKLKTGTLP
jgi:epoxyqueuosine reductase QueG